MVLLQYCYIEGLWCCYSIATLRGYGVALSTNLSVNAVLYYMEYIGEVKCEAWCDSRWCFIRMKSSIVPVALLIHVFYL